MLLAADIGNTNTVLGLYEGATLAASWRLTTTRAQTADEFQFLLTGLLQARGLAASAVRGVIVASVVPTLDGVVREALRRQFNLEPLFVGPGLKTGMPIHYEPPADVGADRIVSPMRYVPVGACRRGGAPVPRASLNA